MYILVTLHYEEEGNEKMNVYRAAKVGTCKQKVGYGFIKTTAKDCRTMGGAMNGSPAANTWTSCHLDWCKDGT